MASRPQRPPSATASARPRNVRADDPQLQLGDEEALLEELARLRSTVAVQHREATEAREKLHKAEEEGWVKDKLLQELLSQARGGSGVDGEVLDQLRGELQALLHVKAKHHEARRQLDEMDQKFLQLQQELRATSIEALMEGVGVAKKEAKDKAEALLKDCVDGDSAFQARLSREAMKEVVAQIEVIEDQRSKGQQQILHLDEETHRYEQEATSNEEQLQRLQEQRVSLDEQMEKCKARLEEHDGFLREKESVEREIEEHASGLLRARQGHQALEETIQEMRQGWKVHESLLAPGFTPLCSGTAGGAAPSSCAAGHPGNAGTHALLWRFRQALGSSRRSGVQALLAEDTDRDGRVSAEQLTRSLQGLGVSGAEPQAVRQLLFALDPALVTETGFVSVVDLILALPQLSRPDAPACAEEMRQVFFWACRRHRKPEAVMRSRLLEWLEDGSAAVAQAPLLAAELSLSQDLALSITRCLEDQRERFVEDLPSWRIPPLASRIALLLRFLRDFASLRDILTPVLDNPELPLATFLEEVGGQFGPRWSQAELEEVALYVEADVAASVSAPVVDGAKLVRAAKSSHGLSLEFPDASKECSEEAREGLEDAAKPIPKGRKRVPEAPVAAPPAEWCISPGPPAQVPVAAPPPPQGAERSEGAPQAVGAIAAAADGAGTIAAASSVAASAGIAAKGVADKAEASGEVANGKASDIASSSASEGEEDDEYQADFANDDDDEDEDEDEDFANEDEDEDEDDDEDEDGDGDSDDEN